MEKEPIEKVKKEKTQPETPQRVKELFKEFLFPCNPDKTPYLQKGETWQFHLDTPKKLVRGIDQPLCGLDLGHAGLIVIDLDIYKDAFKNSKEAYKFWHKVKQKTTFRQKTQSGGEHLFFRQTEKTVGNSVPFPGVDIKGFGGYVCMYADIAPLVNFSSYTELYNAIPIWDIVIEKPTDIPKTQLGLQPLPPIQPTVKRQYGPGKNNSTNAYRAGRAGANNSFKQMAADMTELFNKNQGRSDWDYKTHIKDYFNIAQKNWYFRAEHPKVIKDFINNSRDSLLNGRDVKKVIKPEFWDDQEVIPKNNALLLCGDTQAGKTAFSLNFLADLIKKNEESNVCIWEHSETNRGNRLNQWVSDSKIKEPFMTYKRMEILEKIEPNAVILIDDTDSFFQIKNPTDRREVADCLEAISWICQLVGCTIILCHYQSKTSKGEKNVKCRSGGDMSWINKSRYAALIELGEKSDNKPTVDQGIEETIKSSTHPFLVIQKGNRSKDKPISWWLKEDYSIGEVITDDDLKVLIKQKIEGTTGNPIPDEINKLILGYFKDTGKKQIPTKALYKLCLNNLNLKEGAVKYYLKKHLKNYSIVAEGFGADKKHYLVRN